MLYPIYFKAGFWALLTILSNFMVSIGTEDILPTPDCYIPETLSYKGWSICSDESPVSFV